MDIQQLQSKIDELTEQMDDLKKELERVSQKRIFQQDIVPDVIKMRHMGEGNRFVRAGSATNKPTVGEDATDSLAMYYDVTNHKLWVYDSGWKSVTLS